MGTRSYLLLGPIGLLGSSLVCQSQIDVIRYCRGSGGVRRVEPNWMPGPGEETRQVCTVKPVGE